MILNPGCGEIPQNEDLSFTLLFKTLPGKDIQYPEAGSLPSSFHS